MNGKTYTAQKQLAMTSIVPRSFDSASGYAQDDTGESGEGPLNAAGKKLVILNKVKDL